MTALFVLLVILQALDAWSTLRALKRPGTIEANPVMRWLMDKIGDLEVMLVLKVAACVAIWFAVMGLPADLGALLLIVCALPYIWAIRGNLKLLK